MLMADPNNAKTQKVKNLHVLSKHFFVPKWFYLDVNFFERFLFESQIKDIVDSKLQSLNSENIEAVSADLQRRVAFAKMPEHLEEEVMSMYFGSAVSVRVAFTKIFGDIDQNAFLNISGKERLINAIKVMFSMKYSVKALTRYLKGEWFDVEVIVQEMIKPYCSGVVYSKDVFSENYENSIVKTVLGMMMVESEMTGDVFVVNLGNIVHSINTPQKYAYVQDRTQSATEKIDLGKNSTLPKLNENQVLEIVEISRFVEKIFGGGVRLSFVFSENKFYLISANSLEVQEYTELLNVLAGYGPVIKKIIYDLSDDFEDGLLLLSTAHGLDIEMIRKILDIKVSSKSECVSLLKYAHDIILKYH